MPKFNNNRTELMLTINLNEMYKNRSIWIRFKNCYLQ